MNELHVFFDGFEWWVADSAANARAQQIAESGISEDEAVPVDEWEQWDDDRAVGIEADTEPPSVTTKTCREWAAEKGRGLLGSTEG